MMVLKRSAVLGVVIAVTIIGLLFLLTREKQTEFELLDAKELTVNDLPDPLKAVLVLALIPKDVKALRLKVGFHKPLDDAIVLRALGKYLDDYDERVKAGVGYLATAVRDNKGKQLAWHSQATVLLIREQFCERCEVSLAAIARQVGSTKGWLVFLPLTERWSRL